MKKSIIIIISLMMILSSLSVVAAEALMTTEPITLDPKDVTKDNIKDLSPDAVFNIPVNKLTPDVLGAMSEQQMKNLISSQLTPQVLTTISQNGKLNSDYVNIDQFTLAINKVGSMQLTKIDPNGLSNIKITAGAADTSVNLQDANGNSLRLKDSGAGTFTVDDQGVFHFEGVENLAIWHNGVRKADFTGAGSVDSDGTIVCATDTKVCSATAFEGNPISVKSPKGQVVKISGEDAVVEFGENGDIKTLKGKLEEDYLPANLRHLVLSGKEEGSHYELEASRGSLINFENGEVKNAKSDGSLLVKYDNRADTDVAAAVVHLNNGGEFSMSGSDSAEITSCSGTCSYRNRDTSKMNGFNLPESGVIEINTAKGGSLSFNAGTAVLNGKETSMMALDSKNNVLMSTTNVDAGTTKVMMGNTQVGNAADINSKTCDGKCNLVLFKSTEKGYSSDIYTQNTNKVDVFLMSDNHLNDAHVITQAGGVHGTLAITTIAKNNQNPEYIFPDLSVTQWKEQETSESTSEANTLQTSGKLAEVKIGTSTASTTISVTSTNGQISMLADRLNKNENMYKLSTTNLDGKGGEVLYSDGVNSVLLGVENPGSADQKYALKSVRSGLGITVDNNEKPFVKSVLIEMGMPEKDIQNIQRFGQPLFTDAEQTQIAQEARAKALEEVTRQVEGTTTPAAAATGTQATTPGQGAAAAGTTVSLVPPNLMPPGSVDGKYYTNDPRVIAMLTSMGYGTGTAADIKRFQSKYNIQSDGVVGMQTSTALLIACNNNPTCKSAPTSSNFETEVGPVVNTKMQEVANSPAMQQINKAGEPDSSRPPTPPPAPPAPGQPTPPIPTSTPPPLKPASVASSNYPPECSNGEILIVDVCVPSQLYTAQSTATSGPIQQIVIKDTIGRETTYLPTGPTVSGLTQGIMIPGKDVKPGTFLPYFYTTMEGNTYFLGYQYDDINGKTHYIGKQEADEMSVSADLNQLAQSKSGVTVYRRPTPSASSTVKSVSNPQDWSQQSTQPSSSNDFTEVSEPSVQQGSSHDIASSPKTPVCICEDPCYPDLVGQTCLGDDPTNVNCIAGSISATCS